MRLDKTVASGLEENDKRIKDSCINGKVFYKWGELVGGKINGVKYTPNQMLGIFLMYEFEFKNYGAEKMRELAKRNNHPETWVNFIISVNSNGNDYKRA